MALDSNGDRIDSFEVMNYLVGANSAEYKGMTFKASNTVFQLQEYEGGYQFCSRYPEVIPTIENSLEACKDKCRGCWALTYYAGLETEYERRCYVFMSAADCGTLEGYKDMSGSLRSVMVGIYNSTTQQYRAYNQTVVWPGGTMLAPADYFSGAL